MCQTGAVVACWSLTQEVAERQVGVLLLNYIHTFVTEVTEFSEKFFYKHLGKTLLVDIS